MGNIFFFFQEKISHEGKLTMNVFMVESVKIFLASVSLMAVQRHEAMRDQESG